MKLRTDSFRPWWPIFSGQIFRKHMTTILHFNCRSRKKKRGIGNYDVVASRHDVTAVAGREEKEAVAIIMRRTTARVLLTSGGRGSKPHLISSSSPHTPVHTTPYHDLSTLSDISHQYSVGWGKSQTLLTSSGHGWNYGESPPPWTTHQSAGSPYQYKPMHHYHLPQVHWEYNAK